MQYVIRLEVASRREDRGSKYTFARIRHGVVVVGEPNDSGKLIMLTVPKAAATRFDSYAAAASALVKWAQQVEGSASMWVRNPAIVEVA